MTDLRIEFDKERRNNIPDRGDTMSKVLVLRVRMMRN